MIANGILKTRDQLCLQVLIHHGQNTITRVDLQGIDPHLLPVGELRIDSRLVKSGDIFVALNGDHQDGHLFLAAAVQAGAVAVVVNSSWAVENAKKLEALHVVVIQTQDQVACMADLAKAYRTQYQEIPFIAITGSCGKTTVKNLLGHALSQFSNPLVTFASQNNHLGVPMTMSRLTPDIDIGIAELGANHVGEIAAGVVLVHPIVSVLTGVNAAHIEGFGSLEKTAQAKGEILAGLLPNGVAVLNQDDPYFEYWCQNLKPNIRLISFGTSAQASVRLVKDNLFLHERLIDFGVPKSLVSQPIAFEMPLVGEHNRLNGMIAIAALIGLLSTGNFQWQSQFFSSIGSLFAGVAPARGRLQPHQIGKTLILDDTYNATPAAVSSSLLYLSQQAGEKWFVFGGMAELGESTLSFHERVGIEAAKLGVDQFWAYGTDAGISAEAYARQKAGPIACFTTHDSMNAALSLALQKQKPDCILIKGSRSRKMETIVQFLLDQKN